MSPACEPVSICRGRRASQHFRGCPRILAVKGEGPQRRIRFRDAVPVVRCRRCAGDRFAYQIPAGAAQGAALRAVAAFHARALQVLDGLAAGASQRELAAAIFGNATVVRSWRPDGALRAQVRHLIRKGRAMMGGEYRSLIATDRSVPVSPEGPRTKPLPMRCDIVYDVTSYGALTGRSRYFGDRGRAAQQARRE